MKKETLMQRRGGAEKKKKQEEPAALARGGTRAPGVKQEEPAALARGGTRAPRVADNEPKYSQNPEFFGRAFSLFCKGMSLPKVADALRPEWPDVNERTVQRIASENGWEKSRASYLKLHADAAASAEGLVPEVVMQLQNLRAKMESKAHLSAAEIFGYRSICEDLLWYTGKHPKLKDSTPLAISGDVEVAALLDAIAEDDVVGAAWKKRRGHIEKAYRAKMEQKETAQRKDAKGAKSAKGPKVV